MSLGSSWMSPPLPQARGKTLDPVVAVMGIRVIITSNCALGHVPEGEVEHTARYEEVSQEASLLFPKGKMSHTAD